MNTKAEQEIKNQIRKELIGKNIGDSIVIEHIKRMSKSGYLSHYYKYICGICKKEANAPKPEGEILFKLKHEHPLVCRKCTGKNKHLLSIEIGNQLENLKVIDIYIKKKHKIAKCVCKCGLEIDVLFSCLRRGQSSCINCSNRKYVGDISADYYFQIKKNAMRRNINFDLNKEFLWNLYLKQDKKCAISGMEIYFATTKKEYNKHLQTVSLDRIDSNKYYTEDNVQWVHKDINMMKQQYSHDYFIDCCHKISQHQKEKQCLLSTA